MQAVKADFRSAEKGPQKIWNKAVTLCEDAGLTTLEASGKKAGKLSLQPFFTAKTHVECIPFCLIITEHGTWKRHIGRFLQNSLALMPIEDPFLVRSAMEV
ncbi:hypothetical protein HPB48_005437 [Haemaphysalis longicornis]|uniref:Uncharacterized protein n=1 Tax=Haemaphysalis longicornis TaxID=44386 RepID=A0A9J6GL04_HAELO|nr:hypothetical protein HPB48_005437 [Haemaphysalis longicornis]